MANHRRLRLQWTHEHRAWQADWHQVVFSDESRFNLWDNDDLIRVKHYAGERCLPGCVIERHSGLTPGFMKKISECPKTSLINTYRLHFNTILESSHPKFMGGSGSPIWSRTSSRSVAGSSPGATENDPVGLLRNIKSVNAQCSSIGVVVS
ncbi:transposable element Tcb1 transposase [Trichonephila clavipes]|nr:transposable element Tcb1 transposase [Trichonephila clavipes]